MKGLLLFTIVLLSTVAIEGHGNGWCRGPRSHLNRRFDVGYALKFDGNDFVELPTLSIGGTLTFEFMLKVNGNNQAGTILTFGPANNNIEIALINRKIRFTATRPGNGNSISSTSESSSNIDRDGWQYFVITVESNRRIRFYTADDDSEATGLGQGTLTFLPAFASREQNFIGRGLQANSFFTGDLDEIRIWSRILPTSEMNRERDIPDGDSSLIAWWNFNQGVGIVATDVSFQGRDGTLGGNNFSATPQWIISQFTSTKSCKIYRDVSMKTFDKKSFRIPTSRIGDFWLVDGENAQALAIQVRIQQKPGSHQGTVVKQLAFQYYETIFKWDLDFSSRSDSFFFVNNTQINLNTYEDAFTGVSVYKSFTRNSRHIYEVTAPLGFKMKIEAFPRDYWTDITVRVPVSNRDRVGGLCGDWNGEESGDDRAPVSDTWPAQESLFNGPLNFTVPDEYTCSFISGSSLETDALRVCNNDSVIASYLRIPCLFDICLAGDIGAAYSHAELTYQDCLDDNTTFCRPPCPNFCNLRGTCQVNGVCTCASPWSGADCSQRPTFPCYQASWGNQRRQINSFKGTPSAITHYSYSREFPFSSATGKELSDTTNLYLYNEISTNFLSLIHLNDKARDNTGGRVRANYNIVSPSNPSIKVQDDSPTIDDTYTSINNGNFTANWQWWGCCTDGLVVEVLRNSNINNNFCVNINLTRFEGVNQVVVSSENNYGTSDIYRLDNDRVSICGTTCNNTCGTYSNCGSCTSDPKCGWCVETETCELGTSGGPDRGRCNLWRFSNRNNIPRVIKTEVSYPVDPSAATIYLPSGQATADFFVFVPSPDNLPLDIVLSLDVTKYFGNDLAYIQSATAAVFASMSTYYPEARLGITSFSDVPFQPFGSPSQGDFAYQENLRLTSNSVFIQNVLNGIIPRDGGDVQNSQLTAMYGASRSTNLGWRSNAMKLLVVITKSDFHSPPTTGIPSGSEYPTPTAVRDALLSSNIVPIFVVPTSLQARYQSLITQWGFGYVRGFSSLSASNIFTGIQETVNILSTSIKAISLPSTAPNVNAIYPPEGYSGVSAGTRVVFTATLSATIAGGATIIVPGFGKVDFSFISSDLPSGASQTVNGANGVTSTIAQLFAFGYYGQAYPEITSLPNSNIASIFQVTDGNLKGNPITSVPSTLSDTANKVWIQFSNSGSTSFTYQVKDDCAACSATNYTVSIIFQTSNRAPTATNPGAITFPEDGSRTIPLNGVDPEDGANVVAVITSFPAAGNLYQTSGALITSANPTVIGNNVIFKSGANEFGNPPTYLYSSFTFAVRDSQGLQSAPELVSIFVTPVNDAPVAFSNSTSTPEDIAISISLRATDIEGNVLTYYITQISNNGVLSRVAGGAALNNGESLTGNIVWFTPFPNWNGVTSFDFKANDGGSDSNIATITITVTPVNDAPIVPPNGTPITGNEDTTVPITLLGSDPDSTNIFAIICNWNGVGTLRQIGGNIINPGSDITVTGGRDLTYTPPPNAFSNNIPLTSFTYRISDGSLSSPCVVASITILGVYDPPVAYGPSQVYTNESQTVSIIVRAQNPDLTPTTFQVCVGPTKGVLMSGTVVLTNGTSFNGLPTPPDLTFATLTYTPDSGLSGSPLDFFSFRAIDNVNNSDCVSVNIFVASVNYPPVITNATIYATEDTDFPFTFTATDDDDQNLIYFNITRLPSRGSLFQGDDRTPITTVPTRVSNGTIIFRAAANEFGVNYDTFDYVASDGEATSVTATVGVSVAEENDAPVAYPFTVSFSDQESFILDSQFSGYDIENGTNVGVRIETPASLGTLYICQTIGDPYCNVSSVIPDDAPLRRVRFVPDPTIYGTYIVTFTYSVYDGEDLASVPVTATLNVTKNNNPPVAFPSQSPVPLFRGEFTTLQVIVYDPDVGQQITVEVDPTDVEGFIFQCDPIINGCNPGTPILVPTDLTDDQYRMVYQAPLPSGGSRTASTTLIRVTAKDPLQLLAPAVFVINIFSSDITLIPTSTSLSFGEKETNVPFTLTVNSSDTIQYFITKLPTRGNLTQSDGEPISTVPTLVTDGGRIIFIKPNTVDNGNPYDNFNWTANSTTSTAYTLEPAVTTVYVAPVEDDPIAILYSPPIFFEDTPDLLQLTGYDPDVFTDNDNLTFIIVASASNGGLFYQVDSLNVSFGGPILNGQPVSNSQGYVWFVPPLNFFSSPSSGSIAFSYRVRDSTMRLSNILDAVITVIAVNDIPVAHDSRFSGQNNRPVTDITLSNFTDVEIALAQQTAIITIVTIPQPSLGTLYFDAAISGNEVQPGVNYTTRNFKFMALQPGAFGSDYASFTWRVFDGIDVSNTASATIDIIYINTPPVVVSPSTSLIVDEDSSVEFIVSATDADLTDSVTLEFSVLPSKGSLWYTDENSQTIEPINTFTQLPNETVVTYILDPLAIGTDTFTIQARDYRNFNPLDLSIIKPVVTITIRPINDPPTLDNTQLSLISNGYESPAISTGVTVTDDASENNGIITLTVTSTGAESLKLTNAGALVGYDANATVTTLIVNGTVAQINAALAAGVEFYPAVDTEFGTMSFTVNDNGHNDYRANQPGLTPLSPLADITITVDSEDSIGLSAGFIGVTSLMSAGVFGAYKIMKKKKLIPEEADPWENDELFDMTLDNPLYSGSNPSSLEAVFDSK